MSTRTLWRVVGLGDPPRGRIALSIILGTLAVAAALGLMAASGYLISRAAEQPPILSLTAVVVGVRFFGVARGVARYLERLVSHDAALRALVGLRSALVRHLEPLVPTDLGGLRAGDLLQRFVADVDALQNAILRVLNPIAVGIASGLLAVAIAAITLPVAGLALGLGLIVAGVLLPLTTGALGRQAAARTAPAQALVTSELVDALRCAPELVAFGRADDAVRRVDEASVDLARARRRAALAAALGEGGTTTLTVLTAIAVVALAVPAVAEDRLGGVYLALLALLALAAFEAVRPIPAAIEHLAACTAAADRIAGVIDRPPSITDPPVPAPAPAPDCVALDDVRFRYGSGPLVLDGVSLELRPGRVIALAGPSGSGKSTIALLLVRFLDPQEGAIRLGAVDLRRLRLADVRNAIGLAGQDAHLVPATIRENLRVADPAADDAALWRALERARARSWVERLPDGLDTVIAEDGANVSGGQRQRLALARVLLGGRRFLILDEPAAHLDPETAQPLVRELVESARAAGLGVLLITHDQLEPGLVDEVLDLRDGRLVPRG